MSNVDHPKHYTFGRFEVIDVLMDWFHDLPLLWQVGKYIARAKHKGNMLEDLKKAEWYLKKQIEELEKVKAKTEDYGYDPIKVVGEAQAPATMHQWHYVKRSDGLYFSSNVNNIESWTRNIAQAMAYPSEKDAMAEIHRIVLKPNDGLRHKPVNALDVKENEPF